MSINFTRALGIHEQALQVRAQRAEVLANNMANADTPGYKARDMDFKGILRGEVQSTASHAMMRTTNGQHIQGQQLQMDTDLLYRTPQQPSIDGNTVEDQVEHAAYMENNLAFQASFTFLNSKFRGMMTALRGE